MTVAAAREVDSTDASTAWGRGLRPGADDLSEWEKPAERRSGAGRLARRLSSFGVLLLALSCLSPVFSIYGVGSDVLQHAGTGAAGLFLLGIAAAVVWAVVYAELGSAYPYAGGDYVGVGSILGAWAGAVTLAIWAGTSGPSIAFQCKVMAEYMAELAPQVPAPVTVYGSLILSVLVALLAVRTSAIVTGLFLAVEAVSVLVLLGLGFLHPARGLGTVVLHPVALGAGGLAPTALGVLAVGAVSAVYATVGGNQALYFGEELRDPHRRMGGVVLAACMIGAFSTALPVAAVAIGAPHLEAMFKSPAPIAAFVSQVAGERAGRALSAAVLLAIFNATIVQVMYSARLYFSLGRDRLFPGQRFNRLLADVHDASGAPRTATLVVGVFAAVCCPLKSHTLLLFLTGLLVYGWSLVCLAVIVGRRRGLTGQAGYWRAPLGPLAPVVGLAMAAVFTVADLEDADGGRPSLLLLGAVVLAAIAWSELVLRRRPGGWTPTLADLEV